MPTAGALLATAEPAVHAAPPTQPVPHAVVHSSTTPVLQPEQSTHADARKQLAPSRPPADAHSSLEKKSGLSGREQQHPGSYGGRYQVLIL